MSLLVGGSNIHSIIVLSSTTMHEWKSHAFKHKGMNEPVWTKSLISASIIWLRKMTREYVSHMYLYLSLQNVRNETLIKSKFLDEERKETAKIIHCYTQDRDSETLL